MKRISSYKKYFFAFFIILSLMLVGVICKEYKVAANKKLIEEKQKKAIEIEKIKKAKQGEAEENLEEKLISQDIKESKLNNKKEIVAKVQAQMKQEQENKLKEEAAKKANAAAVKTASAAKATAPEPVKYVKLDVPYVNQKKPLYAPMGCEGASILMCLKYKNATNIDYKTFMDRMPISPDNNPFDGFAGSPFSIVPDVFQSIFPQALANYCSIYSSKVANISGDSCEDLKNELRNGNAVTVYVTNRLFEAPKLKTYNFGGKDYTIVDNMHVVALAGFNDNDNTYYIADPNDKGYYWISKSKFETAYNCLRWAVVVR